MLAAKRIYLFLAFCAIIIFPKFGKCSAIFKQISNVPKEDEATICFKKFEKGEIECGKIKECIQEFRKKNGVGTFISIEKAFKEYIDRSVVQVSQISKNIYKLAEELKNNRTNPRCIASIWIPAANGEIPLGALQIEQDSKVYVSRAFFREQVYRPGPKFSTKLMPGKIQVGHTAAYVPAFPNELSIFEYEVLIIPSEAVEWMPFNNSVPQNAVIGGYEEHLEKENIYIGRVKQQRSYFSGENYEVGPILMDEGVYKLITTYNYGAFKHDQFEIVVLKNDPSCVQK